MQVHYDNQAKVAGIGILPWPRLGLERWFTSYTIASLYNWETGSMELLPKNIAAIDQFPDMRLPKANTPNLLANPDFQHLLSEHLEGYNFLTYRAVSPPAALITAGCRFLGVDPNLQSRLENKATVRELLADKEIPFPPFRLLESSSITPDQQGLTTVLNGADVVVLQDEQLSGGQGTYLIRSLADLITALGKLTRVGGNRVVVSEYLDGARERTLQACITRYGVFVGPVQKQIVSNPHLANMNVPGAGRYCGGETTPNDPIGAAAEELQALAQTVGQHLQIMGYRGVFGLDCMVTAEGRVFLLEINPRLTGITPLLTMRYREGQDIPFLLLHVLELANFDYTIPDQYIDPTPSAGSILVVHAMNTVPAKITTSLEPGLYNMEHKTLMNHQMRFNESESIPQLLFQPAVLAGSTIKPGGRAHLLLMNRTVLDEQDNLTDDAIAAIDWLRAQMQLKDVTA